MEDLGRVVAEHCGGNVTEIALPETDGTAVDEALLDGQPVRYLETKKAPHISSYTLTTHYRL